MMTAQTEGVASVVGEPVEGRRRIQWLVMATAVVVVVVRFWAPLRCGWDQGVQLEGAQRWYGGQGLTSTFFVENDTNLNVAPTPLPLTWWPPGFSVMAAGLLCSGIPVALGLKCFFALLTLVGWWGWGALCRTYLARPLRLGALPIPANYALAIVLVVSWTPMWDGTDLVLWALAPFVVLLLERSFRPLASNTWAALAAGALVGVAYSYRYAAVSLGIFGAYVLLAKSGKGRAAAAGRFALFLSGALVVASPVFLYVARNKTGSGLPEYVSVGSAFVNLGSATCRVLDGLPAIAHVFLWPAVQAIGVRVAPGLQLVFGLACLIGVVLLPVLPQRGNEARGAPEPHLGSLAFLPLAVVTLLVLMMFIHSYDYLGDPRYYVAAGPSAVLVIYRVATLQPRAGGFSLVLTLAVGLAIAHDLLYRATAVTTGPGLIASAPFRYHEGRGLARPDNELVRSKPDSYQLLKELKTEHPNAVFYVCGEVFSDYVIDGNPGIRPIPQDPGFWRQAHISEPTEIYWFVPAGSEAVSASLSILAAGPLDSTQPLEQVAIFPTEKVRVVTAVYPPGPVLQARLHEPRSRVGRDARPLLPGVPPGARPEHYR